MQSCKTCNVWIAIQKLCYAEVPYTYFTLRYNDKSDSPDNEYYIRGADEYTKYLVNKFMRYNKLKGRNISLDRYYVNPVVLRKKIHCRNNEN